MTVILNRDQFFDRACDVASLPTVAGTAWNRLVELYDAEVHCRLREPYGIVFRDHPSAAEAHWNHRLVDDLEVTSVIPLLERINEVEATYNEDGRVHHARKFAVRQVISRNLIGRTVTVGPNIVDIWAKVAYDAIAVDKT